MIPLLVLAGSAGLSALFMPLVRRFARGTGLYAQPTDDRWHRRPVPKLGGAAMAAVLLPVAWYFANSTALRMLVVAASCLAALGLYDDVRPIRPIAKFTGQVAAALLFLSFVPAAPLTGRPALDLLLSFLWFVGITNAFNLLDNIDGLAAGIAAIAGVFLAVTFHVSGSPELAGFIPVVTALTGVTLGFLIYNWHPASIFMGDSGSQLIGAFLAGMTLLAAPNMREGSPAGVLITVIILLVPCLDTALVIVTRHLAGRHAMVGGRDHLSHRIVALGVGERDAVLVLYGIAIAGGFVALALQTLSPPAGWALATAYGIAVGAIGVFLGRAPVTKTRGAPLAEEPAGGRSKYAASLVLFDTSLIMLGYFLGLLTRFPEVERFGFFLERFMRILPLVIGLHLLSLWVVGRYRRTGVTTANEDRLAIAQGSLLGSAATIIAVLYVTRFEGYSRWAFAVAAFLVLIFLTSGQVVLQWLRKRIR